MGVVVAGHVEPWAAIGLRDLLDVVEVHLTGGDGRHLSQALFEPCGQRGGAEGIIAQL